eukprot:jgi/Tetstr1/434177/TSEL_023288.t1
MTKRALLVGCNYPGTQAALNGCVNDVHRMREMLISTFGFNDCDITVMIDTDSSYTQPTGGNVKRALSKLVAESQHGDVALFHFSGHASKSVAEGDADYDRKGKRPAQPAAVEAPSRTIHAPEDGWLDKDGKVHRRHTADARILQRDLDDVFQIYDLLAPAEEPLRDLVEDGADLPASSPVSSAELFKTITAALALCTTVAVRL